MEEVEVEVEQGEVELEVAAVEEEGAEEQVEVEARRAGRQQRLAIPADRPGWSVQEGIVAQAFWVASHSQLYQLLSSLKSLLLRYKICRVYAPYPYPHNYNINTLLSGFSKTVFLLKQIFTH